MIVECNKCHTKYNVDDKKVPAAGVKVRCHKCQSIIFIKREAIVSHPTVPEKPTEPAARLSEQPLPEPSAEVPKPAEQVPAPDVEPSAEVPKPAEQVPTPDVEPGAEVPKPVEQVPVPDVEPGAEVPKPAEQAPVPDVIPGAEVPKPAEQVPEPDVIPGAEVPKPVEREVPPEPELPLGAEKAVVEKAKPTPPAAEMSEEDTKWHQRARRLAKALASDLVLYNKDKVERGLRDGTLIQLLGIEIKRSWEYYCQQIPKHIVENSDYFKEQLNKIVGEGKEIFK